MLKRTWTGQEILALLKRYPVEGPLYLAAEMNRSEDSISSQARRWSLRKTRESYRRRSKTAERIESRQCQDYTPKRDPQPE